MNSRIRVLHVIKSLGRGGAEMLLPETLRKHDQAKFDFHYIYFLPWKNQMVESLHQAGGKVTCISAKNNFQLMLKVMEVARYVKKHNIRVVHAHLPWAGILCRFVGIITGVPVLYTEHNKQERYHWATRRINLLTMNLLTAVIAVSEDVASSVRKFKPNLTVPLKTIVNGVNTEHFDRQNFTESSVRKSFGIPSDALVIGTVAVFRFQKRLDLWLDIAARIIEKIPHAHFVIVGDGPLKQQLLQKRSALGLENKVHMAGIQTEVRPFMAAFDIYMMSSIFEGLPVALLEAMSMGCAIASTDAGGIKEVIRHEQDGLLCPVNEPEKLIDLVYRLAQNPVDRQIFRTQARQRVISGFSMSKMTHTLEQLYLQSLKE